jgi:hypothetical protein
VPKLKFGNIQNYQDVLTEYINFRNCKLILTEILMTENQISALSGTKIRLSVVSQC